MPTKKAVKKKCDSVHGFVTFLILLSLVCGISMGLASKALNSATALDRATWATWATCSKHVFVAFVASHLIAKVQRVEGGLLAKR